MEIRQFLIRNFEFLGTSDLNGLWIVEGSLFLYIPSLRLLDNISLVLDSRLNEHHIGRITDPNFSLFICDQFGSNFLLLEPTSNRHTDSQSLHRFAVFAQNDNVVLVFGSGEILVDQVLLVVLGQGDIVRGR